MKTIEEFLKKLSTFEYNDFDYKNKIKGSDGTNKIEVSYNMEISNCILTVEKMPIQLVLHVKLNGHKVSSWGCVDGEDNSKAVKWFIETQNKAQKKSFDDERKAKKLAEHIFNS